MATFSGISCRNGVVAVVVVVVMVLYPSEARQATHTTFALGPTLSLNCSIVTSSVCCQVNSLVGCYFFSLFFSLLVYLFTGPIVYLRLFSVLFGSPPFTLPSFVFCSSQSGKASFFPPELSYTYIPRHYA